MNFLEKFRFSFGNSSYMIASLIRKWKPGTLKTGESYEHALYEYLHNQLNELPVSRQYAKGRIRASLAVGNKVIIEIKKNLNSTSSYQRLIEQISEYKDGGVNVIILLTGKTDHDIKKQLDQYLEEENITTNILGDPVITVIEKR